MGGAGGAGVLTRSGTANFVQSFRSTTIPCDFRTSVILAQAGKGARTVKLTKDEEFSIKGLGLITIKPMIYAANVPESDLADKGANNPYVKASAGGKGSRAVDRECDF